MLFSVSEEKPVSSQPLGKMLKRHFVLDFLISLLLFVIWGARDSLEKKKERMVKLLLRISKHYFSHIQNFQSFLFGGNNVFAAQ